MADAYTVGIRKQLTSKGIPNSDISYNPQSGAVTVKGQDFLKGQKNYGGTNYTNQQSFNAAWDTYNKGQQKPSYTASTAGANVGSQTGGYKPAGYQPANISNPKTGYAPVQPQPAAQQQPAYQQPQQMPVQSYPMGTPSIDQRIQELYNYGQQQQAFDPYSSSAYKAAEAQAQRQAMQGIRSAQESMGASGFGRSTALAERAQGVQNDATNYLMTQVLPQIEAQEQARRQQEYQNLYNLLQPQQQQQQFEESRSQGRAGITGRLITPEAQNAMNDLTNLKTYAEQNWQTMTPQGREQVRAEGDALRAVLQSAQIDPNLFGAGVKSTQAMANVGQAGIPTLASKDQDMRGQQQGFEQRANIRDFNRGVLESDRNYEISKENAAIQQRGANIANELASLQLENYPEEQRLRLEQMQKEIAQIGKNPYQSAADQRMDELKIEMAELELDKIRSGETGQQTAEDMRTYFDSMVQRDKYDNTVTNPEVMENAILNSDMSDYDKYQMYLRYGIQWGGPVPKK